MFSCIDASFSLTTKLKFTKSEEEVEVEKVEEEVYQKIIFIYKLSSTYFAACLLLF